MRFSPQINDRVTNCTISVTVKYGFCRVLLLLSVTVTYTIRVNLIYLTVPGQGQGKYTKDL